MRTTHTRIIRYGRDPEALRERRTQTAISLHSHSSCSREQLGFIPQAARELPVVGRLFDRGATQFCRALGQPIDFESVYWRPPVSPERLFSSEQRQIAERLNTEGLVAVTDHDTLEGPVRMRSRGAAGAPYSVEWSVDVHDTVLHLGVHNLPEARVVEAEARLGRPCGDVAALLDWLGECRDTFVVLNHPWWDQTGIGALRHEAILLSFLRSHGHRIHALELNGYRGWSENRRVLPLAEAFELPVVAGGDRHGHAPNAMLMLTEAGSFAEFAEWLRARRPTTCVIFPEYFEPFAGRVFAGVREVLEGDAVRGSWSERLFFSVDGVERTFASVWPRGGPWWLRGGFEVARLLGAQPLRPLFRLALSGEQPVV